METYTDPARELIDLCDALSSRVAERGSAFLAKKFQVEPWSPDFFDILSAIGKRFDDLDGIVAKLDLDADIGKIALAHIASVRRAFSEAGLVNDWVYSLDNFINASNVGPIRTLSGQVRGVCKYPKLDPKDIEEILIAINELIARLDELQLAEEDFIRQSLLEGLKGVRFRLERLNWVGRGYVLDSLKSVIAAYIVLERGAPDQQTAPDAHAVLVLTKAGLSKIYEKLKLGKDIFDTADWALKMYGAATIYFQTQQTIAGLLSHLSSR